MPTPAETTTKDLFPDERLAPTAALVHAQIALGAALRKRAVEPSGLDPDTADLLVRLSKAADGSLRGVDIGRQLMINPARVSRLLDRAEALDLIERQADAADRRAQRISLTTQGRRRAASYAPLMLEVLDEAVFDEFSTGELDTLVALLRRLNASAAEAAAG